MELIEIGLIIIVAAMAAMAALRKIIETTLFFWIDE